MTDLVDTGELFQWHYYPNRKNVTDPATISDPFTFDNGGEAEPQESHDHTPVVPDSLPAEPNDDLVLAGKFGAPSLANGDRRRSTVSFGPDAARLFAI
jgi:hypothetical protein